MTELAIFVLLALIAGALAGVLWARHQAAPRLEGLQAELADARRQLDATTAAHQAWKASADEHRRTEEQARQELREAFAKLSQDALAVNSQQFLAQASESLEQRRRAIDELLKPFKETLDKLERNTHELEGKRELAYGALQQQLQALHQATESLGQQSRSLVGALRGDARARGRWGELALRNVVELAGMTRHCDFSEQETVGEAGARPDMLINLPGGGRIPVDAKVPMDAYMRALECEDPGARTAELQKHATDLRGHVRRLEARAYASQVGVGLDMTVMFVPAEPVLSAAFEADPSIQAEAIEKRVLIATPVTLVALLRTVALYWQQSRLAQDAQRVWEHARDFQARVAVFSEHLERMGRGLRTAVESFNQAVGSYESRVVPAARRLEELEAPAGAQRPVAELPAIDVHPRLGERREKEEPV
ncbi:MAG: DNA recombination protein RmuC [Acidobacteria bacterium]|nr:DNA recombination protein RmuC [Acidobacteriota bacterium]